LSSSRIESLPPSIGQLQNLEYLNLSYTTNLSALPEDFGTNLISLKTLDLSSSSMESLPPSIGQLQNLEYLNLSHTRNLSELPEELGANLISLKRLKLSHSSITSLPPSIGWLRNLEKIDLGGAENISELPDEIGKLLKFRTLNLTRSGITSLPDSLARLMSPLSLNIRDTRMLKSKSFKDQLEFVVKLAQRFRSLVKLDHEFSKSTALNYVLVSNEFWLKLGFGNSDQKNSIQATPNLWPFVLSSAEVLLGFSEADAVYWLLNDGRESFVGILLDRSMRTRPEK
jgi:hypothetical protein